MATAAEIKVGFSGDAARKAACALELQGGEGRSRTLYFWDSPGKGGDGISLPFLDRGVIFRLRLEDGDHGSKRETDMTVKLRPCPRLPPGWRKNRKDEDGAWDFTIEEDRTGPAFTPVVSPRCRPTGRSRRSSSSRCSDPGPERWTTSSPSRTATFWRTPQG